MRRNHILVICIFTIAISLLTACSSEGKKLKNTVNEAFTNQDKVENYQFTGSALLQYDMQISNPENNPLTSGFISLLTNSNMTWSGIASKKPTQLESVISVTPNGSASPIKIPVIIKENKLYFNVPVFNINQDEYLTIDLPEVNSTLQDNGFPSILMHIMAGIPPKYYKEIDKDHKSTRTIVVDITEENGKEILQASHSKLPLIIEEFEDNGFLSATQADKLRNNIKDTDEVLNDFKIDKPGLISVVVDPDGFIIEQKLNLYFSNNIIEINYSLENINETQEFNHEIPKQTRSFDDIIEQLSGSNN